MDLDWMECITFRGVRYKTDDVITAINLVGVPYGEYAGDASIIRTINKMPAETYNKLIELLKGSEIKKTESCPAEPTR